MTSRKVMLRSRFPPSRTASSGETRLARMAGITADRTVTTRPTMTTTTIVRGWIWSGPSGKVPSPVLLKSCFSSQATPMPPTSPTADAMRPTITASMSTMARIWGPLAPIDRSRPSWRVR